jgi:hypothetical protein
MSRTVDGSGDCSGGMNGQNGLNGLDATVSVGTVTSLPSNNGAYVTNTGTSTNAIFNFGIPAGVAGAAGANGANGIDAYVNSAKFYHVQSVWIAGVATTMTLTNSGYGLTAGFNGPGVPALNDSFRTIEFQLLPGTYTFYLVASRLSNRGLVTWYFDNSLVSFGTTDFYLNGSDYAILSIPNVTVTATANNLHTLRGVVTKHVNSSGYYVYLSLLWFQ